MLKYINIKVLASSDIPLIGDALMSTRFWFGRGTLEKFTVHRAPREKENNAFKK